MYLGENKVRKKIFVSYLLHRTGRTNSGPSFELYFGIVVVVVVVEKTVVVDWRFFEIVSRPRGRP